MVILPPYLQEALNELDKVCKDPNHTTEKIREATRLVHEERARAIIESPEYADMLRRKAEAVKRESRSSMPSAPSRKKRYEAHAGTDSDEWVQQHKVKVLSPDEAEARADDKLACPNPACRDHGKNRGNTVNDVPTCMACWHRLVPKSELPYKNRKYWRRWNKRKQA